MSRVNRLSLDPAGLEAGVLTVLLDGDPVCALDLDNYPPEIPSELDAEYDALCDAVDSERAA